MLPKDIPPNSIWRDAPGLDQTAPKCIPDVYPHLVFMSCGVGEETQRGKEAKIDAYMGLELFVRFEKYMKQTSQVCQKSRLRLSEKRATT